MTLPPDVASAKPSVRSFDFSKCPNLKEVDIGTGGKSGELFWIPVALSTLRPATSPHLSAIKLNFFHLPAGSLIEDASNDTVWLADEVARIEREFEGTVDFTVLRSPGDDVDKLDVRSRFCRVDDASLTGLHSFPTLVLQRNVSWIGSAGTLLT